MKETSSASILQKYGGEEYLEKLPRELLSGQTEDYVEYSRTGQVVKGQERAKAKSKYDEDGASLLFSSSLHRPSLLFSSRSLLLTLVSSSSFRPPTVHPGNHTSVWGSFYSILSGLWGYACCHSSIKSSYCAGKASIEAAAAEARGGLGIVDQDERRKEVEPREAQKSMLQIKMEEQEREKVEKRKRKVEEVEGEEKEEEEEKRKKSVMGFATGVTEEEMGTFFFFLPFDVTFGVV